MRFARIAACGLLLTLSLAACKPEGPAEKAGDSIDRAGQKVQDTVDPPKGPAQSLGRTIDRNTP